MASFREAVIKSLPPDNGLYFPETIPQLNVLASSDKPSLQEVGAEIMKPFCAPDLTEQVVEEIINDTLTFEIPLVEVAPGLLSLELFHGPTFAFKDVGARFLARCLSHLRQSDDREVTILVATSGDTGGAVASGFHGVPGIRVVILYPSGRISKLQEQQLTTLGDNITALEVEGTFDDCQRLVKQAFLDIELNQELALSSANSINIARWIPQSIYYFWASLQFPGQEVAFSVPSGNYGNLAAGILAKKMSAPIRRFIASSNLNDVFPRYLASGSYDPHDTIATYSNAMDVGNPSNFPRILELYENEHDQIVDITGDRLTDEETLSTMKECWEQHQYLLDPHGAIGYQLLKTYEQPDEIGIFLETAHPCKFAPIIQKVIPAYELPAFTQELLSKEKQSISCPNQYEAFKALLIR